MLIPLLVALLVCAGLQELLWRRLDQFLKIQGAGRVTRGFSLDHLFTVHYLTAGHRLLGWYRLAYLATGVLLLLTLAAGVFWLLGRTA